MGATDKTKNSMEGFRGKVRTLTGRLTGNRSTQARGRGQQIKADMKGAGEQIKDSARKLRHTTKH